MAIGDLHREPAHRIQLHPTSTRDNLYFTVTNPNPSQGQAGWFRSGMTTLPETRPELDMQAVGWEIADHNNFDVPRINEWDDLAFEGFSAEPEAIPFDHAANDEWLVWAHASKIPTFSVCKNPGCALLAESAAKRFADQRVATRVLRRAPKKPCF
ncbi:hypothetical protein RHGRI_028176 [Rhododendron griersonianum]|uniref:Uncharacterized protein n=1 Tax=Rhododendron griersonianum TaxID=479676 RepID=A0AAV6IET1_9ERIC|nr:hypothetical protein RHGRI_028176 [Rhododendron griersonianum]